MFSIMLFNTCSSSRESAGITGWWPWWPYPSLSLRRGECLFCHVDNAHREACKEHTAHSRVLPTPQVWQWHLSHQARTWLHHLHSGCLRSSSVVWGYFPNTTSPKSHTIVPEQIILLLIMLQREDVANVPQMHKNLRWARCTR